MAKRSAIDIFHWPLFLSALLVLAIGLVNLYSASAAAEGPFFLSQLAWSAVAVLVGVLVYAVDYRVYERLAYPFFFVVLALLLAVLFSRPIAGSQRWLVLGPLRLQPSELMKLAVLLVLAKHFHDAASPKEGYGLWQLRRVGFFIAAPMALVVLEPDLGTALLIGAVGFTMVVFVKLRTRAFLTLLLLAALLLPLGWEFALKDYQKNRIETLFNPDIDPRGTGYHRRQSIIAVGSGQLSGKGFKNGTQSQLRFLPEQHTDFIFSVWAEEHGFLGGSLLIGLYLVIVLSGLHVASKAREKFGALCALGATSVFFWQAFINIGMVIGVLPVVGVTLPMMSYGGTSLVVSAVAVALPLNIYARRYLF